MNLSKRHPTTYEALVALSGQADAAVAASGLSPRLVELVKIRVSQINGCAFCLRLHTRDALAAGETTDRLAVLPAWWESQYFDATEQAALALAEQVTEIHSPAAHAASADALTPEQASAVAWLAVVMNAWNRVAITSHYPVGP